MPNERTHKIAEEALQRLSDELEAGHSEALKNYLSAIGRFHQYSWNNTLLIHAQRPGATHVAGIHAWNDLGRKVKHGEKGIAILAPVIVKTKENPDPLVERGKEPFRVSGFRTAYVFDVSQTDGKPLPAFAATTGDPKDFTQKLKSIVAGRGISVEYDAAIAPAQGVSTGGAIRLQPGLAPAEEFSVLAHELAHEMMHHQSADPKLSKIVRETQAEAVAYVVCQAAGLETNHAAADYIALYTGDKKTLADSLSAIQETSAKILDELMPQERTSPAIVPSVASTGETRLPEQPADPQPNQGPDLTRDMPQWDR